jgi:hypothetical protein
VERVRRLSKSISFNEDTEINPFDYIIHFESAFKRKTIGETFHEFLKTEESEKDWLYLTSFKRFESTKEKKQKLEIFKTILQDFLLDSSTFEVDLSKKYKSLAQEFYESFMLENNQRQSNFEEMTINQAHENLLEPIYKLLHEKLRLDAWKRFSRTETATSLIKLHYKNFDICSPQIIKNFSHTDEYFDHPFIFDLDFEFADLLFKDHSQWKLIQTNYKNHTNAFISKTNYLPNVSYAKNISNIKFECILSVSFDSLVFAYATNTNKMKSDNFISHIETKEFYNYKELVKIFKEKGWESQIGSFERSLAVNVSHIQFPMIFVPRIKNHSCSMYYDRKTETLTYLCKTFILDDMKFAEICVTDICPEAGKPMKKMKAYPIFGYTFYRFHKIDDKHVSFSHVLMLDFGGWANNETLLNMIIVSAKTGRFKEKLMNYIQQYPEDLKIEDYKEMLMEEKNGKVVDGMGKMLYELNIHQK